ncbi:CHAT domain-containing protein, partial [Oscillochloris sp. ZM17-4]|uniref:CHAT domain-containing protein n=1 Tax=Oscillochloris sp. ZM17-4 TaxID=2866714 RepID=UPI001C72D49C
ADSALLKPCLSTSNIAVRWESDTLGVRHSTFSPPYSAEDLPLVIKALDQLQQLSCGFSSAEVERLAALGIPVCNGLIVDTAHQTVGRTLHRALTSDPAGAIALQIAREMASSTGVPLSLRLRFPPNATALAALPWELLWGDEPTPLLLSRGQLAPCTRHIDLSAAIPPTRSITTPLRILPITPHAGIAAADRQAEQEARNKTWQPLIDQGDVIMLAEVSPATPRAIVDAIQAGPPPDIIHYVGHGAYRNGQGYLILDQPTGGWNPTPVSRLLPLFGGVCLVVLATCQGAMVGADPDQAQPSLLSGVAPALSAAGVPMVVGMQLTIRMAALNRATAVIYRALAQGKSIQDAVSTARQALYVEEPDGASWYVPVVYIRSRETGPAYLIPPGNGTRGRM